MRKQKSVLRSTRPTTTNTTKEPHNKPEDRRKHRDSVLKIWDVEDDFMQQIYSEQTGHFPKQSLRGMEYIIVLAEVDSNAILVEPLHNQTAGELVRGFLAIVARLKRRKIRPKKLMLDNECSTKFKEAATEKKLTHELTPPTDH